MNYIKIHIHTQDTAIKELWLGILGNLDQIEGIEELENEHLLAYTQDWAAIAATINEWQEHTKVSIVTTEEPNQNWNAKWESDFQPVVLEGFCAVRAYFHEIIPGVQYDIKITPKMSFGTGHHATTRLVMGQMKNIDFKDKTVFDYGTGTGILAILAAMLGAKQVDAIDIDEWSYENALENVANNNCDNVNIGLGEIAWAQGKKYDIILANINRHILLESMTEMHNLLNDNGLLLLSGILKLQDTHIILKKANNCGFDLQVQTDEDGWTAILFKKV